MVDESAWLLAIQRHAASGAHRLAITEATPDATTSWTWSELVAQVAARTHALHATVPAIPGQTTTVLAALPSGLDLAAWIGASICAGVRLALMHPRSGAGEFAAVRARTRATAVLGGEELLGKVDARVVRLPLVVGHDPERAAAAGATAPGTAPGSIVLGSSGTTGLPKLVIRDSAALDADARAVASGLGLTTGDRVLCVPPLCHSYGMDLLLGSLYAGAALFVMREFDPADAARLIGEGVTVLPGVPFVFEALARVEVPKSSRLRMTVSAGTALSPRVREAFTSRWKIDVGQLYGATELGTVSVGVPGSKDFDAGCIGKPLPGVSFRVLDLATGTREVGAGEEGQLAVRAPSMLSGYMDGALELVDGHLLTGDLARRDGLGRYTITGRLKLLIDSGGFKVNPLEVERVLSEHPGVRECAVAGLALSDTIQRLFAFVVPRDRTHAPTDRELRAFLRERLAPTKIPRGFRMVEALPRSAIGKLLRDQLPRSGDPGEMGDDS